MPAPPVLSAAPEERVPERPTVPLPAPTPTATSSLTARPAAPALRFDQAPPSRAKFLARTSGPAEPMDTNVASAATPTTADELRPMLAQREPAPAPPRHMNAISIPAAHDFGAIVDRLVEARQTGASVATSAIVSHHEFGQVRLRLSESEGGLSIAMSSPDSGFAPAADAAIRAAAPTPEPASPLPPPSPSPGSGLSGQSQDALAGQRGSGSYSPPAPPPQPWEPRPVADDAPAKRNPDAKAPCGVYA